MAAVKRERPVVNIISRTNPESRDKTACGDSVPIYNTGTLNNVIARTRWIRLERMIDSGMIDRGNLDFFINPRSLTIDGVAFDRETEKKFQISSPMNRWK